MKQRLVTKFVPGIKALRLHLLCEYKTHVHKVQGKHGCEVILQEKEWEEIHGLVVEGLKWVFLAIKVGAHITMGIGDLVPNPSKAYAKAVSDSVGSHLPIDWATVTPQELVMDAASAVRTAQKESAEQWLVDFLKDKSILKKFGLQRVIYKDEQTAEVGWICEEHLKKGEQTGQLARLPCGGTGL
jgi:tRNA nucleotidyltransferase/poly(A) polymerase